MIERILKVGAGVQQWRLRARFFSLIILAAATCISGCDDRDGEVPPGEVDYGVTEPEAIGLNRLTRSQYLNAIHDLLGDGFALPPTLEPDLEADGLLAIGASRSTLSPRGVELYEASARSLAAQAVDTEERQRRLVSCQFEPRVDDPCFEGFVASFGRRAWRRTLNEDEQGGLIDIGVSAAEALDDPWAAVEYVVSALLQSPHFLYRVETGEPDSAESETRHFTAFEMASRLALFLWNGIPDDILLDAAEAGELADEVLLAAQVDRMLGDPRVRRAIRNFFVEWLQLHKLDAMRKDPNIFRHYSSDLGSMAREETLSLVDYLFVDGDADFRDLLTTRRTFVNRRLAAVYNVPATVDTGFGAIDLPTDGLRRGFLGQVSFLGLHSHAVSTSATLRGLFIREVLMCAETPPPPAGLDTSIPEATEEAPTLRLRLASHLTDPFCAGCHTFTDIPGLAFENFDGLGRHRLTENGATIDASGDLDGIAFDGFQDLTALLAASPQVTACLVHKLFDYATGQATGPGYAATLNELAASFEQSGHSIRGLLRSIAMSPGFRLAGEVE